MVKKGAVLPLALTALLLAGCEYFNAPIQPFVDMNTAAVSLNGVNIGVQAAGDRVVDYEAGKEAYEIPVALSNPQQFNIQVTMTSALKNNAPAAAAEVQLVGWTKNEALLEIRGAQMRDVYQITLRITSKDGVASGERTFDISLPLIRFTHQAVKDALVSRVDAVPHAQWKIQRNAGAVSIKKIIIEFSYVDHDISIAPRNRRIEYGWDDSSDMLLLDGNAVGGFTATPIDGYLECDLVFPADFELPAAPPDYAVTILGCSFRVTVEDEFGFPAAAESSGFGGASSNYAVKWEGHSFYANLQNAAAAISAAGTGTETNPDVITVFTDISMAGNITIPSGKYVKIKSDATQRTLKRVAGNTASLFTVNGELTLENIIVDGGAVWEGGTAAPPSPAFGATNAGLNAANTLVLVNGGSAKLTLGAGAVLQNNYNNGASIPDNLGGGIRATGGAQVFINGTGAAVRYNFAGWTGGGIALFDYTAQGTKLTLINGSIDNNKANYGGGITTEHGSIDMQGGFVTKNYAPSASGGINFSNCNTGLTASISGGSISENRAGFAGGIRIEGPWTITMSGSAVISGNEATTQGGGVYMETGSLTMSGNAKISGNTATTQGGGIYMSGGSFTLSGSAVISGNTAQSGGGGVWVNNGTFTINGGAVNNNSSSSDAGGVGCAGSVTMNGGAINGNSGGNGAGVWIGFSNTFTMTAGTITNNTGSSAVYVDSGTLDMRGGSISGNEGYAFNINGWGSPSVRTLKLNGAAYIAPDNPVSFNVSCMTLQVMGTLTGTGVVAKITPAAYTTGTLILSGPYGAVNHHKFAVTPDGSTQYSIDSTGKLALSP